MIPWGCISRQEQDSGTKLEGSNLSHAVPLFDALVCISTNWIFTSLTVCSGYISTFPFIYKAEREGQGFTSVTIKEGSFISSPNLYRALKIWILPSGSTIELFSNSSVRSSMLLPPSVVFITFPVISSFLLPALGLCFGSALPKPYPLQEQPQTH